jgi:hypothetical protein
MQSLYPACPQARTTRRIMTDKCLFKAVIEDTEFSVIPL